MNTCKDCFHKNVCYKIEHYGRDLESSEPCEHFIHIHSISLYAFPSTLNHIKEMDEKITNIYKISGYTLDDIFERLLKGYDFVLPRKTSAAEDLAILNPAHSCTNCKNIVGRFDCSCPYCKKKLEKE